MRTERFDIQGRLLGMPYDFRRPTFRKVAARLWAPGAPVLVPRSFGAGWTLNFANRATWWLLLGAAAGWLLTVALVS